MIKTTFISFLLLYTTTGFSQTAASTSILHIRNVVAQINADSGYAIKKISAEDFLGEITDNGAELDGFFKNGQLIKIKESIGLSSCFNITEYYLEAGKLIFSYTKGSQSPYIDSLQTFDETKLNVTMECRFYFLNGKLIQSILKGRSRCSGEPTKALATIILNDSERYKKLLQKK